MLLTIFTPTYNRAYSLPKLYHSLKEQSNRDFEWLIVDDGSVDETESLVSRWQTEGAVSIRYIRQENGGKMKAHNRGVLETKMPLFVCIDSDDWLIADGVEAILTTWAQEEISKNENLCGMVAYRGKNELKPLGNEFPEGIAKSTLSGLYNVGFEGDTTLVFKTEILREHLFPIIHGEKFITEAYVYDQLDEKYQFFVLPKIITICNYQADGLTRNLDSILFRNPCGYTAYVIQKGNFAKSIKSKFSWYIRANCFRSKIRGVELPVKPNHRFLYHLAYPFGLVLYWKKKRNLKRGLKEETMHE